MIGIVFLPSWLVRIVRILVSPFAFLLCAMIALFAVLEWSTQSDLAASGVPMRAAVVSAHDGTDGRTYLKLHYVVDGEPYDREEMAIDPSLYDQSGEIDILYDPKEPRTHRIVGTERSVGSFLGQLVGGLVGMVLAVVMFLGVRIRVS